MHKIQEMKEAMKRTKKDRHLILNLKMMVRDCKAPSFFVENVPASTLFKTVETDYTTT